MAMSGLRPLCVWGAFLLSVSLLPLERPLGEGQREPDLVGGQAGVLDLPLIQVLSSQGPPSRHRGQSTGQPLHYMLDLYRSEADQHGHPRRNRRLPGNTVRLVQPFAKARQPGAGPWLLWDLDYHLEVRPHVERLVKATLVYSQISASPNGLFWCQAKVPSGGSPAPFRTNPSLTSWHADKTNSSSVPAEDYWVEMDLSGHLRPWNWAFTKSLVLRVRQACVFRRQPWAPQLDSGWEDTASLSDPFVLLHLNDTQGGFQTSLGHPGSEQASLSEASPGSAAHIRRPRQAAQLALDLPGYICPSSLKKKVCALHQFHVSFRDLGWDHWIIAPHSYRPQYCKGTCPRVLRFGYHSPNHAIVQNFINELVDQSVPRPSCVPYQYSPISVLMREPNGSILYKVYEDMVAKSCTCR